MPTRPDRNNFANLGKYVRYINTSFEKRTKLFVGSFYSFVYDFDKNQNFNKIKFYDMMPLIYLFDKHPNHKNIVRGINFHHMPINIRYIYTSKMRNIAENNFKKNTRILMLTEYAKLFNMYRKATKASIRQYDITKIRDLRKIPNSQIENVLGYYAKTYYGINIGMVEANYLMVVV